MVLNELPLTPVEFHNCRELQESACQREDQLLALLNEGEKDPGSEIQASTLEKLLFQTGVFDLIRNEIYPLPGLPALWLVLDSPNLQSEMNKLRKWLDSTQKDPSLLPGQSSRFLFQLDRQIENIEAFLSNSSPKKRSTKLEASCLHLNRILFALATDKKVEIKNDIQLHSNPSENSKPIDWYLLRALNRLRFHPDPKLEAHLYQFSYDPVLQEILNISREIGPRRMRFILENSYLNKGSPEFPSKYQETLQRLREEGIEVRTDTHQGHSGSGQSHNKFFLINDSWVWSGSVNITKRGLRENFNHGLELKSKKLNSIYRKEFEQMWEGKLQTKKWDSPLPSTLWIGESRIEVLFSPQHFIDHRIARILLMARSSIHIGMFYLTNPTLLKVLSFQHERGVKIRLMLDDLTTGARISGRGSIKETLGDYLSSRKIPFRTDGTRKLFHHKFALIDGENGNNPMVITGSMNWTSGAVTKNDENVLIIHNQRIAREYLSIFQKAYGKESQVNQDSSLIEDYEPPAQLQQLRRSGPDLLVSITPFETNLFLSHGKKTYNDIFWEEGIRYLKIPGFFERSRDGAIALEHPLLGPVDAFFYSNRNGYISKGVSKEWRRLSIMGEWEECQGISPDEDCAFDLQNQGMNFCIEKVANFNRIIDWNECHQRRD